MVRTSYCVRSLVPVHAWGGEPGKGCCVGKTGAWNKLIARAAACTWPDYYALSSYVAVV